MKIVKDYPPNIEKIRKALPLIKGVIFCYGDTIFNPDGGEVTDDLIVHESVHTIQQGEDIEGWWNKYLSDVQFRLSQEVDAYRSQYQFALSNYSRQKIRPLLKRISKHLSSSVYGKLVSEIEAKELITRYFV